MRFSIITITLNAEKFLKETLNSVSEQGFQDYEHLIWDGGSQDSTLEMIAAFPRVKLFQGKDSGISDAMNRAARLAQGDYLLFLHADDLLIDSTVLADYDTLLRQAGDPQWAYGQAEVIDESGNTLEIKERIPFESKRLRKYNILTHPAVVVEKNLFLSSGGFRTDLKYAMDYELWLRLAQSHRAVDLPLLVAKFREHQGSLSTREALAVTHEAYRVRNDYVRNWWERYRSYRTWKRRCRGIVEKMAR